MKVTSDSSFFILRVFFGQLTSSITFIASLIVSLLPSIFIAFLSDSFWITIFTYLQYLGFSICILLGSIALQTAVHEQGHMKVAKQLGILAELSVNRIGDVWFEYPDYTISEDESYQVGIGPYLKMIDMILPWALMAGWVAYSLFAPAFLKNFFLILTGLYFIMAMATIAGFLTVRKKLHTGRIVKFAWFFSSRGDIAGMMNYHKNIGESM